MELDLSCLFELTLIYKKCLEVDVFFSLVELTLETRYGAVGDVLMSLEVVEVNPEFSLLLQV